MSTPPHAEAGEAELLVPGLIHEMRHPLAGIKAGLQLIAGALGTQVTRLDDWDMVLGQVRRLEETLQSYQRLIEPTGEPAICYSPEPVVRWALDLLRFRTRALGERFALRVDEPVAAVRGSPSALLHAVTNLVVNALDAVEEAPAPARVEVRIRPGGPSGGAEVRVADQGPGLTADAARRLFELRFTTKAPGKGTGLGLPIARRLIEAAGGSVRVVLPGEEGRAPWAATELAIALPPGEVGP